VDLKLPPLSTGTDSQSGARTPAEHAELLRRQPVTLDAYRVLQDDVDPSDPDFSPGDYLIEPGPEPEAAAESEAEEAHFKPLDLTAVRTPNLAVRITASQSPLPRQPTLVAHDEPAGVSITTPTLAGPSSEQVSSNLNLPPRLASTRASEELAGLYSESLASLPTSPSASASTGEVIEALTSDPVEVRAFRKITNYARHLQSSVPRNGPHPAGMWHPKQVLTRSKLYLSPEELDAVTGTARGTRTERHNPVPGGETESSSAGSTPASGTSMLSLPPDAWLPIVYDEGFPTINGLFLWEMLPGEPPSYHRLFKIYLDQFRDPRGQKARPGYKAKSRVVTQAGRSLQLLHQDLPDDQVTKYPIAKLEAIYYLYGWGDRVAAYDAYMDAEINFRLAHIAGDMDARHLQFSQRLFEESAERIMGAIDEFDPKTLLDLVKFAVALERTSLGRTESNSTPKNGPQVLVQTLNQLNAPPGGGTSGGSSPSQGLPSALAGAQGRLGANHRAPGGVVAVTRNRGAQSPPSGPSGPGGSSSFDLMSALRDPVKAALLQKLALELQGANTGTGANARGQS
jgi:hypothetical protein